MTHQIELGDVLHDSFPVYNSDGYTRRTGETVFTAYLYENGSVSAEVVTISEIGSSGEYEVSFTPTSVGNWKLSVLVDYDKTWWETDVDVSDPNAHATAESQINVAFDDSVPRMYMQVWLDRAGQTVHQANLVSCQVIAYDMIGTVLFTEASVLPKADDHFSLQHDLGLTADRPYNLKVTVTDSAGTVVSFHGISTVS